MRTSTQPPAIPTCPSVVRSPVEKPVRRTRQSDLRIAGKTLLDMARDDYSDPATLQQSRALMRRVINHYLAGQALHTRQLLRDMQFS